jgi:hypothetical protein
MLLVSLVVSTAGCVPAPEPRTDVPVRGCYDDLRPGGADVRYTGEPSELDNLEWWTSTDGSCTGDRVPEELVRSTLIVAPDAGAAEVLCRMLLARDLLGAMDSAGGQWSPAFGPGAFTCVP